MTTTQTKPKLTTTDQRTQTQHDRDDATVAAIMAGGGITIKAACDHYNSVTQAKIANTVHRIKSAPTLSAPPPEIADTGKVRLGDGFISAEFPPLPAKAG